MGLQIGLVGLPNVGKSTAFKALTKKQVPAENYPFCTIDPNIGVVAVPDKRLDRLAEISESKKIVPTTIEFVDIAGLVKGASQGEGLGNQFLSHIREVDAIAMVVREFKDEKIIHVYDRIDPTDDIDIIKLELIFADLDTVNKRISATEKKASLGDKEAKMEYTVAIKYKEALSADKLANTVEFSDEEKKTAHQFQLLTAKPFIYIRNVDEHTAIAEAKKIDTDFLDHLSHQETPEVTICALMEAELAEMDETDTKQYLKEVGISYTGLDRMILACYRALNLVSFLTTGPDESRAWTVRANTKAPQAAAVIHTDFEKNFIRVEVIKYADLDRLGNELAVKQAGLMQTLGKDYIIQDGDVVNFIVGV